MSIESQAGISIIMPCYNAGEFVRAAIDSVEAHMQISKSLTGKKTPFEIILVDDGSDEQTREIIRRLEAEDRLHLKVHYFEKNSGQSAARNFALEQAQYDFILPVDADDLLTTDPKVLELGSFPQRAIEMLQQNSGLALVVPNTLLCGTRSGPFFKSNSTLERLLLRGRFVNASVFRKKDALSVGGYQTDLSCFEDWALYISLFNKRFIEGKGLKIKTFDEYFYLYRQHDHGHNVSAQARDIVGFRLKMYELYSPLFHEIFKNKIDCGESMKSFLRSQPEIFTLGEKFGLATSHPFWFADRMMIRAFNSLSETGSAMAGISKEFPSLLVIRRISQMP